MATDPILPGSRWRHLRRGTVYTVVCLSEREADREPLVTYRGDDGRTWTRPVSEWRERFECVDAKPDDLVSRDRALELVEAATPGPWCSGWEDADTSDEAPIIYSVAGDDVVAGMWYDGPRCALTQPDAALIAAAPDLGRTVVALHDEVAALRARVAALEADRARGDLPAGLPALPDGWAWRWAPNDDLTVDLWHGDELTGWVFLPDAPGEEVAVGMMGCGPLWRPDLPTAAAALLRAVGVGGTDA